MSRDIKFRAWDIKNNKFFEPTYEAYAGKLEDISIDLHGSILRRTLEMPAEHIPKDEIYILSQYTGLTDRNGKEIYEGDIVRAEGYKEFIDKVEYRGTAFTFQGDALSDFSQICNGDIEVIGNVWENPHLLTKEETK